MIGHLGPRVSALLDGQLSAADEERAWDHVHGCHECRDQVEREGWVKTQLVELSFGQTCASADLKGALLVSGWGAMTAAAPEQLLELAGRPRRSPISALGGGAAGAVVLGVLALGTASPANAPTSIGQGSGWGRTFTETVASIVDRGAGRETRVERQGPAGGLRARPVDHSATGVSVPALRRTLTP